MEDSKYIINYNKRNLNDLRGEYDTALITVDSQINSTWSGYGLQTVDPITRAFNGKSNAGFVSVLANPIVLDNNYQYVLAVSKVSFDIFNYNSSGITTSFYVGIDIIDYQYYEGQMIQCLHKTQPVECTLNTTTGQISPFCDEPRNIIYRYINTPTKVISRLTFQITGSDGFPLDSFDSTVPTQIQLVLKKVSPEQQY